ncbi:hypothetical protein [Lysobacter sp. CA199]|uniref:hypothetical protein n=1 Tax=Lysobacter sp. CA199 TaxID=3455608 RepID=UPI003F8D4C82
MTMRILGYSYEATIVCPACALADAEEGRIIPDGRIRFEHDEHGLLDNLEDHHGNPLRPVFSTDEGAHDEFCGSCLERLEWCL